VLRFNCIQLYYKECRGVKCNVACLWELLMKWGEV